MKRIHIYILTAMALLNSSCSADWLDLNTTSSVETGQAIVTLQMYRHVSPKETENAYLPIMNTMCSLPII